MLLWWELRWHLQGARATIKGGTDLGAHISGGLQVVFGVSGATIFAGPEVVQSAGTAIGTTVFGSGAEIVSSGGTTTGTARRGKRDSGAPVTARYRFPSGHWLGRLKTVTGREPATELEGGADGCGPFR
jgi:hypothetical protein